MKLVSTFAHRQTKVFRWLFLPEATCTCSMFWQVLWHHPAESLTLQSFWDVPDILYVWSSSWQPNAFSHWSLHPPVIANEDTIATVWCSFQLPTLKTDLLVLRLWCQKLQSRGDFGFEAAIVRQSGSILHPTSSYCRSWWSKFRRHKRRAMIWLNSQGWLNITFIPHHFLGENKNKTCNFFWSHQLAGIAMRAFRRT